MSGSHKAGSQTQSKQHISQQPRPSNTSSILTANNLISHVACDVPERDILAQTRFHNHVTNCHPRQRLPCENKHIRCPRRHRRAWRGSRCDGRSPKWKLLSRHTTRTRRHWLHLYYFKCKYALDQLELAFASFSRCRNQFDVHVVFHATWRDDVILGKPYSICLAATRRVNNRQFAFTSCLSSSSS